jgi:hypothetical protein
MGFNHSPPTADALQDLDIVLHNTLHFRLKPIAVEKGAEIGRLRHGHTWFHWDITSNASLQLGGHALAVTTRCAFSPVMDEAGR